MFEAGGLKSLGAKLGVCMRLEYVWMAWDQDPGYDIEDVRAQERGWVLNLGNKMWDKPWGREAEYKACKQRLEAGS